MDEQPDMLRQAYICMRSALEADDEFSMRVNVELATAYAAVAQADAATRQAEAMERMAATFPDCTNSPSSCSG